MDKTDYGLWGKGILDIIRSRQEMTNDPFVEGKPQNNRYENWRKQKQADIENHIRAGRVNIPDEFYLPENTKIKFKEIPSTLLSKDPIQKSAPKTNEELLAEILEII